MNKTIKNTLLIAVGELLIIFTILNQFLFKASYILSIIMIYAFMIGCIMYLKRNDGNELFKCNLICVIFSIGIKFTTIVGLSIENNFSNLTNDIFIIICIFIGALFFVDLLYFFKSPNSIYYKYYMIINIIILYLLEVCAVNTFWVLLTALPLITVCTVFDNLKLIVCSGIILNIINMIGAYFRVTNLTGKDLSYAHWMYSVEIVLMFTYTISLIHTSLIIKISNQKKVEEINIEKEKNISISNDVTEISKNIKFNTGIIEGIIEKLELSMTTMLSSLNNIADENIKSVNSVETQSEMVSNISNMLDSIFKGLDNAFTLIDTTLSILDNSNDTFDKLTAKSDVISNHNKVINNVINNFVVNVRSVHDITANIVEVSEQTNLLALNASIESARVGDESKGFALVSSEIKNLAESSTILIDDIERIVRKLEFNALKTKEEVCKVVNEIDEEYVTIHNIKQEFKQMKNRVAILRQNVLSVLDKVKSIMNLNTKIERHVASLAASDEEVTACTEEVVTLGKDNQTKTYETKTLMDELAEEVNKLDKYL